MQAQLDDLRDQLAAAKASAPAVVPATCYASASIIALNRSGKLHCGPEARIPAETGAPPAAAS